jgi:hypothetical protein
LERFAPVNADFQGVEIGRELGLDCPLKDFRDSLCKSFLLRLSGMVRLSIYDFYVRRIALQKCTFGYFIGAVMMTTFLQSQFSRADVDGQGEVTGLSFSQDGLNVIASYSFSNGRLKLLNSDPLDAYRPLN